MLELHLKSHPYRGSPLGAILVLTARLSRQSAYFAAGDYAVQDAASLLPLTLMQLRAGQRVIDCCVLPGGKSAAILDRLNGTGFLVATK